MGEGVSDPAGACEVLEVTATGVALSTDDDLVLDVRIDGRRIWSFRTLRDSQALDDRRQVPWPRVLVPRLVGSASVAIGRHGQQEALFEREVAFDDSGTPVDLTDREGHPLGVDNTGALTPTFENRTAEENQPLLDSLEHVLGQLQAMGIAAFPAYGTLLGAVREERLIGHDSDADIAYVSRHSDPVDVVRESFALQRALNQLGLRTSRYSGISFRVLVIEVGGFIRGLDVFGGYLDGGRLNMMGEIRISFERAWIFPLGTCRLEGRTLPAPARPEKLLEAMYGPGWSVPDPSFAFETPARTIRAFNELFRQTRARRRQWARVFTRRGVPDLSDCPSPLAEHVRECEGVPDQLFDVGAGRGADGLWFARQGASTTAYDHLIFATAPAVEQAEEEGLDFGFRRLNLQEWRSVLVEGARAGRRPGPRTLVANHVFEATPRFGRDALARFARMSLADGGRLYADFWCGGGSPLPDHPSRPVAVEEVARVLTATGAVIVDRSEWEPAGSEGRRTGRVVARWR